MKLEKKILIVLLLMPFALHAQHPTMQNDTVYYKTAKIFVGDTVHLAYGSAATKDFAFVYVGSGASGLEKLPAGWAKYDVVIDKIVEKNSHLNARGVMLAKGFNSFNKIFIQIEGAIDNNEILTE